MKNRTLWIVLGVITIVIVITIGSLIGLYNNLVQKEQGVESQWAQVETQYQRRFDLIPNLVKNTKGIFKQEKEVFAALANARTKYSGAQTPDQKVAAANSLESALGRLLMIVENYPQLKSSEAVNNLMVQLEGTENRVSVERRRYNEVVQEFNISIKKFPNSFFSTLLGFKPKPYFKASVGSEKAPEVNFE